MGSLDKIELPIHKSVLARKTTKKPFGKGTKAESSLQIIQSDICGLISVRARHSASYFIIFIDNYSHFGHVYLISHKSEASDCFKKNFKIS